MTASGTDSYTTAYTYDANNRLTTEAKTQSGTTTTSVYTYDDNGNLLTELDATNTAVVTHSYDGFNRLISSVVGTATTIIYAYNAQGIRTSRQVGNTYTQYLLDGGNVVGETTDGTLSALYVRGANLIQMQSAAGELYYLYNAHGDVVQLTGSTGAVTKTYEYDAFGNEKNSSDTDTNPFRYCGEYYDTETGLYYLRARYYDPTVGRFTQEDTHWNTANMIYGDNPQKINEREDALGLKTYSYAPQILSILQAGNLYVYCVDNPVLYSDQSGMLAEFAAVIMTEGSMGVKDLFIYGQGTCVYAEDDYGLAKIKNVGCEIVATYNALVQIGEYRDFNSIKSDFIVRNYIMLYGFFGSNPTKIDNYLSALAVESKTYYSKQRFENSLSDGSVFIMSFWLYPFTKGIHTIMGVYSGGAYIVYNYYNNDTGIREFSNLDNILKNGSFILGINIKG